MTVKLSEMKPVTTVSEIAPCRVKLEIEIPADYVTQVLAYSAQRICSEARLPGFRPGKAPKAMVERRYADTIVSEARDFLLQSAIEKACDEKSLTMESDPVVEGQKSRNEIAVAKGEPVKFAVSFDTAPTFTLPDCSDLAITRDTVEIGDSAVNEVVRNLLREHISYQTVERAAEKGDLLKVSYTAEVEGVAEIPASAKYILEAKSTWMPLSEPELIPGAAKALLGATPGNLYHVETTFPAEFYEQSLAGKKANYKITIEEIQSAHIPEFTDEMAKQVTGGQSDAATTLKNIRSYLESQENHKADMGFREKVADAVLAKVDFPLPPETLERTTYEEVRRLAEAEYRRSRGSMEAFEKKREEIFAQGKKNAEKALKRRYVFTAIAKQEGIKVDREDIDAVIESLAQSSGTTPKAMLKRIQSNGRLNELFRNILESKAIDFVATKLEKKA